MICGWPKQAKVGLIRQDWPSTFMLHIITIFCFLYARIPPNIRGESGLPRHDAEHHVSNTKFFLLYYEKIFLTFDWNITSSYDEAFGCMKDWRVEYAGYFCIQRLFIYSLRFSLTDSLQGDADLTLEGSSVEMLAIPPEIK